jgi:hypothetical protein
MPELPAAPWPLTKAELGRRYGVDRATITKVLARADKLHRENPHTNRKPPAPVDPDAVQLRYMAAEFDKFWERRPRGGRPPLRPQMES